MNDYNRKVELYGDGIGSVEYVDHMGTDLTVVNSARVSFGVEKTQLDNRDKKLIKYLMSHKHTSTLEHCTVTFRFKVPLFVRSQHHRHRTWAYNEISRRYTDIGIEFYAPSEFRTQHKSNRQASSDVVTNPVINSSYMGIGFENADAAVKNHHARALSLYNGMINAGVCREQARGVLPQNLYTEYYGTANLNNLLKFIELRTHDGAQWEIQKVAQGCLDIAKDLYPEAVSAWRCLHDNEG